MGNLNLSFIENSSQIRPTGFTNSIIDFLETYGLHACSDERQGLTIDGLKISGSAQAIHKRRMLHHATLLFSTDLETLEHVLCPSIEYTTGHDTAARPYFVPSVKSPVTNLSGKLPVPITIDKFKQSLLAYFSARSTAFRPYEFTDQDLEEIRLLRNKNMLTKTGYSILTPCNIELSVSLPCSIITIEQTEIFTVDLFIRR